MAPCQRLGAASEPAGLQYAMDYAREGDVLVVWRLDHFGRSLKDLIAKVETLEDKGVQFKSLKENLDTISSAG